MRAAAAAGGAAFLGAALLVPALLPLGRRRRAGPAVAAAPGEAAPGPPPMPPVHLRVRNVSKIYPGGHRALARISFELGPGIVGLLGPNGAGKTTLIRCLVGLLSPSRGQVLFAGRPLSPETLPGYRRRIGFLPQDFNAYPGLSGEAFLDYWASARGLPGGAARRAEIEQLLAEVGLAEHGRRKVRDYSGGMRRRLGIAAALLGAPQILIVDEPTTGLDIESRSRFRETLLAAAGDRIVLLSTHIASDVEAIAPRLLLLSGGRLAFDGSPETLIARARGRVFEALLQDAELAPFSHRYQVTSRVRQLAGIRVRAVARPGVELGGPAVEPSLEEAYLAALQDE